MQSFEINAREDIFRLISMRDRYFKTKGDDKKTIEEIMSLPTFRHIEKLVKTTRFEPTITGKPEENSFVVKTTYHLQMDDWQHFIDPIIKFYKSLIDKYSS
ncbi:hypothetical protein [Robertkochia aurantiaca]|uniref:hypothetical protein n=1 Tax=Robertkochia aurantiaca TaxID=2873700 RepID=UPI001CCC6F5F|nr:hypothetical protein [Robertkochia sp. 3YJGBD-33]